MAVHFCIFYISYKREKILQKMFCATLRYLYLILQWLRIILQGIFGVALQCAMIVQCCTTLCSGCAFLQFLRSQVREKILKKCNHCTVLPNIAKPFCNFAQHLLCLSEHCTTLSQYFAKAQPLANFSNSNKLMHFHAILLNGCVMWNKANLVSCNIA